MTAAEFYETGFGRFLLSPGFGGVMALLAATLAYRAAMKKVSADREQARQEATREERAAAYKKADEAFEKADQLVERLFEDRDEWPIALNVAAWRLDEATADLDVYCPDDVAKAARDYADSLEAAARQAWHTPIARPVERYTSPLLRALVIADNARARSAFLVVSGVRESRLAYARAHYVKLKRIDLGYGRPPTLRVRAARAVASFVFTIVLYGGLLYLALRTWPSIVPFVGDLLAQARDATEAAWRDIRERR